ncbi:MAG: hypothetical protein V4760_06445 [Bdellovibrionota bacterium]
MSKLMVVVTLQPIKEHACDWPRARGEQAKAMAQHDDRSSGKPPAKPLASKTLHRTLQELESALADWDKVGETPASSPAEPTPKAKNPLEEEMRERTKKLLAELRRQLSEFSD